MEYDGNCHLIIVGFLKRQKCELLNRTNHSNYARYNFSATEIILNWNLKSDEVLCASLGFTSISFYAFLAIIYGP